MPRDRLWSRPRPGEAPPPYRGRVWLAGPPPEPLRPAPEPPPEPPKRRRPWIIPLAAALAGAAVVVLALAVLGAGSDDDGGRTNLDPLPAAKGGSAGRLDPGRIYAAASPGVVSVLARESGGQSTGTGFVIDSKGTIVTNQHVVENSGNVQVRFGAQGRLLSARVLGTDPSSDLAVLRVNGNVPRKLRALPLADSSKVRVGDGVVAIGNPFGLDRTATAGIVSGTGRNITAPNGFTIERVIQTDAPINPGNSGGPLLDARGRVIGVNSQIETGGAGRGNVGIGFAVPSNTVRDVVPRLERGEEIRRPYLGVSTAPVPAGRAGRLGLPAGEGAEVASVIPDGPADKAGIQTDDVIVSVDGRQVDDPSDVSLALEGKEPGDVVNVEVVHPDGGRDALDVRLATRPKRTP